MSRSYRRPYSAICGNGSAKEDKRIAARGMRRRLNQWLHNLEDYDESGLIPHRLECSHNDVWGWNRDGKQRYCVPSMTEWNGYLKVVNNGPFRNKWEEEHLKKYNSVWPPEWYRQITRK
jgi:hypothetical protein